MKKLYFLFVASQTVFLVTAQCTIPPNLQNGLLALYTFGNSSINDASGNLHHLSNTTTAHTTTDRFGNVNCAFEFDNIPATNNEFLSTTSTTFLNGLTQFSISVWYQPLDITRDIGAYEGLVNRDTPFSCPDRLGQWSVGLYDCRNAVFARQNSVWNTSPCNIINNTGIWRHIIATYNATGQTLKIYFDGVLTNTATGVANCGIVPVTVQDIGDLFLGKFYTGKLDDIFIYNREVTFGEVSQLYGLSSLCCATLANESYNLNDNFKLYPNPAKKSLTIQFDTDVKINAIEIYNTLGQLVLQPNLTTTIDISTLKTGNYFIKVITDKGISNSKFIKE
jgi:Secretion system C-terminal sorting domain/Concanavalin A-like lectin/glucanases superfamily